MRPDGSRQRVLQAVGGDVAVAQNPPTLLTSTSRRDTRRGSLRRGGALQPGTKVGAEPVHGRIARRPTVSTAAASARSGSRPVMATRAPSSASPIAVALPIPLGAACDEHGLPRHRAGLFNHHGRPRPPSVGAAALAAPTWTFPVSRRCRLGCGPCPPGGRVRRAVRPGQDVGDHREEPEVQFPSRRPRRTTPCCRAARYSAGLRSGPRGRRLGRQ